MYGEHKNNKRLTTILDHKNLSKFNIGDKVLMYRAALEHSRSNKLRSEVQGPFFVYECLPKDVYRLWTIDGKLLVAPINVKDLKEVL